MTRYYDEDLERWVDDEDDELTAAPPSRRPPRARPASASTGASTDDLQVELPSGAPFAVSSAVEEEFLAKLVQRYHEDNAVQNISDQQDLDEVIRKEFFLYRWGNQLSTGRDHNDDPVDEAALRRDSESYSKELRLAKKHLGLDRAARERLKGDNSFPVWIANVLQRAEAFGINREKMADRCLERSMELIGLVTFATNCDDNQRVEFKVTDADIVKWVREKFEPEIMEVDAHFKTHDQRYWIREQ